MPRPHLSPTRLLLAALVLTLCVTGWLSWNVYSANQTLSTTIASDIRLYELRGEILHLDEVLTMSARMAALTGERTWISRYNTYVPQLDATIQETISLVPSLLASEIRAETDAANTQLIALEADALRAVEQNQLADARAIMFSSEYDRQKQIYASGMTKLLTYVQTSVQTRQQDQQRQTPVVFGVLAVLLSLLIFTWVTVLRSLQSSMAVREALLVAQTREQALEQTRIRQEELIAERTVDLRVALQAVEQREAQLNITVDDLRQSQITIRDLSTPVLTVLPGVLVAPMIGALDAERTQLLSEQVLHRTQQQSARAVIFDVTGVPVIDTQVAHLLMRLASAVRLLGAKTLLVGIRPEIAQTIVALNIDLLSIKVYPSLQEAVWALRS